MPEFRGIIIFLAKKTFVYAVGTARKTSKHR